MRGYTVTEMPALASGTARYAGEAVAAVVAESRYVAEDAIERIAVDYAPLDGGDRSESRHGRTAPAAARGRGAQRHPEPRVLPGRRRRRRSPDPRSRWRDRFRFHRHAAVAIENRACLAEWDAGTSRLTLWTSTQVPGHDPRGARRAARDSGAPDPCGRARRRRRLRDEERALSRGGRGRRRWRASSAARSSGSATGARTCSRARRPGTRTSRPSWASTATAASAGSARRCGRTSAPTRSIRGPPASR